jgi:hypothetical protein
LRALVILWGALAAPPSIAAQTGAPVGFAEIEIERSRACVVVLKRLYDLNQSLHPLGLSSKRMRLLLESISVEDRSVMDSLDRSHTTESALYDWFVSDGRLAQSIVDTGNQSLQQQRTINREQIRAAVQAQVDAIQSDADAIMDGAEGLEVQANLCDGAILIRPVVLEACETEESPVCEVATDTSGTPAYSFVDSPEDLWDIQQMRPWSQPSELQVAPDGSLTGASTIAFARYGNVVLTVAFSPLIVGRDALSEEEVAEFEGIVDSLGFEFDHPDLVYAPSLVVSATLPDPLAGEDSYVLHFGEGDDADFLWTGAASTGELIQVPVVLDARHVVRLQAGELIRLTGVTSTEDADSEALFTLELTTVNQVSATRALLGYMAGQMVADLNRLVPPTG